MRKLKGSVTEVGKSLLSAAEVSKTYDSHLWSDGDILVPKDGQLGRKVRDFIWRQIKDAGKEGCIDLFRENDVYNAYLQVGKAKLDEQCRMLAPMPGAEAGGEIAVVRSPPSPNGMQAKL